MLFGVVYFILCGFNKKSGSGVNIVFMACINCVRRLYGTDVTVGGDNDVRDVFVCGGAVNNIMSRGRDKVLVLRQCNVGWDVGNFSKEGPLFIVVFSSSGMNRAES